MPIRSCAARWRSGSLSTPSRTTRSSSSSTEGRVLTWNLGAERIKGYTRPGDRRQAFFESSTPRQTAPPVGRGHFSGMRPMRAGSRTRAGGSGRTARGSGRTSSSPPSATKTASHTPSQRSPRDLTERRASEERVGSFWPSSGRAPRPRRRSQARDRFLEHCITRAENARRHPPVCRPRRFSKPESSGRLDADRLETGLAPDPDRIPPARRPRRGASRHLPPHGGCVCRSTVEPTDLVDLASEVIARFADAGVGGRVSLDAPVAGLIADIDPSRIDQVITNLVDNALKYSRAAGRCGREAAGSSATPSSYRSLIAASGSTRLRRSGCSTRSVAAMPSNTCLGSGWASTSPGRSSRVMEGRIDAAPNEDGPGATFTVRLPRTADAEAP